MTASTGVPPVSVSVVIPAYKAARFIRDTLASVQAQTLPAEIIVVDDGSPDETGAIVSREFPDVRLLRQENQGVSLARNLGLRHARGRYVCFCDADDWMAPGNLEAKVGFLDGHPDHVLVHSWVEVTDEGLEPTGDVLRGAEGWVGTRLMALIPPAIPCPSNVVIRRSLVEEVGGFDPRLSTSADFDLWLRLVVLGPVGRIDAPLVRYRRHAGAMFADLELQQRDMRYIVAKYRRKEGAVGELDWPLLQSKYNLTMGKARLRAGQPLRSAGHLLRWAYHTLRRGV